MAIKLGIIGCGIAATDLHWPFLQKLTDKFKITLVCNHTEPKAKRFSEMTGADYVLDYQELLASDKVEAVLILLPIEHNYTVTKAALKAGKHVIVEKPLAVNMEEAAAMVQLPEQYPDLKMMVAENHVYRQVYQYALEQLQSGVIGEAYSAFWDIFYAIAPDDKFAATSWRKNHKYQGGFITDGGIHHVSNVRQFFGNISIESSFTKTINPKLGEIDTLSFMFKSENKSVDGVMNIFFSPRDYDAERILILGRKGSIIIEDGETVSVKSEGKIIAEKHFEKADDIGYREEMEDFHHAITSNSPVSYPFVEGYHDLRTVLEAINFGENVPSV